MGVPGLRCAAEKGGPTQGQPADCQAVRASQDQPRCGVVLGFKAPQVDRQSERPSSLLWPSFAAWQVHGPWQSALVHIHRVSRHGMAGEAGEVLACQPALHAMTATLRQVLSAKATRTRGRQRPAASSGTRRQSVQRASRAAPHPAWTPRASLCLECFGRCALWRGGGHR